MMVVTRTIELSAAHIDRIVKEWFDGHHNDGDREFGDSPTPMAGGLQVTRDGPGGTPQVRLTLADDLRDVIAAWVNADDDGIAYEDVSSEDVTVTFDPLGRVTATIRITVSDDRDAGTGSLSLSDVLSGRAG